VLYDVRVESARCDALALRDQPLHVCPRLAIGGPTSAAPCLGLDNAQTFSSRLDVAEERELLQLATCQRAVMFCVRLDGGGALDALLVVLTLHNRSLHKAPA
jgi:hypothetical protein